MGIQSNSIRDLNKVTIYKAKKGQKVDALFTGYAVGDPPSFDFGVNMNDPIQSLSDNLFQTTIGRFAAQQLLGVSGNISFARKMQFTGTSPLKFTIQCFLVAENSYRKDIAEPINKLCDYLLPRADSRQISSEGIMKKSQELKAKAQAKAESAGKESTLGTVIWNALANLAEDIHNYTEGVYGLTAPEQLTDDKDFITLNLEYGNLSIPSVYITGFSVKFPKFMMVDEFGNPMPDHAVVTFNFETSRILQNDTIRL